MADLCRGGGTGTQVRCRRYLRDSMLPPGKTAVHSWRGRRISRRRRKWEGVEGEHFRVRLQLFNSGPDCFEMDEPGAIDHAARVAGFRCF